MPKPRALGNTAKAVINDIIDILDTNQPAYFDVVIHLQRNEIESAVEMLRGMAEGNRLALKALTLLTNGDVTGADALLIEEKLTKRD
jgi:hypothetical protein